MKAIWRGVLNFGLITIDIELFSAIKKHRVSFKLLHDACKKPIHNLHWCSHCDKQVSWEHIVKGLPLTKNTYFVISKESLHALKPLHTDDLFIISCISSEQVDPILFNEHYYALPIKKTEHAYTLFVKALETTNKVAIAHIVFKEKEHICMLRPYKNQLLLTTLHFVGEIRPLPAKVTKTKIVPEELELAEYLITRLAKKKIAFEKFKDTFVENVKKAVAKGPTTAAPKKIPKKKPVSKESLIEQLQASLNTNKSARHRA